MRLHIYGGFWAANWAESEGATEADPGECEPIDARATDAAHRLLYALVAALVEHGERVGYYPDRVTVCLSAEQEREIGDVRARFWRGRWDTEHARTLAGWVHKRRIRVATVRATARELAWMEEWAGKVATEGLTIGGGGVASLVAA